MPKLLPDLVVLGYSAVCIDRNGYADGAKSIEKELGAILGSAPVESADGRCSYFTLAAYAASVRAERDPAEWESTGERLRDKPILTGWDKGFRAEESSPTRRWRWAVGPHGELNLLSRAKEPVRVTLRFGVSAYAPGDNSLRIGVGDYRETIPLTQAERVVTHSFEIPPGRSTVTFDYVGAIEPDYFPEILVFAVANYELIDP